MIYNLNHIRISFLTWEFSSKYNTSILYIWTISTCISKIFYVQLTSLSICFFLCFNLSMNLDMKLCLSIIFICWSSIVKFQLQNRQWTELFMFLTYSWYVSYFITLLHIITSHCYHKRRTGAESLGSNLLVILSIKMKMSHYTIKIFIIQDSIAYLLISVCGLCII